MWDVGDVGCWRCGMFGMWDVRDVGCSGCGMLIYKISITTIVTKEYWRIFIKKPDKGSTIVVWNSNDYILEAEKQFSDANAYKDVSFNEKILQELAATSNQAFQNLKPKGKISDTQLKYFTYEYKKVSNLGKLYLLTKIHNRLHNVRGRPVISNCGTPMEKAEFIDYYLKPIMQEGKSYIKDSGDFIKKKIKTSNGCKLGYGGCSRPLSEYSIRGWFECS